VNVSRNSVRAVERQPGIVDQVDGVGRGGAAEQPRRRRARIDDAMPGVHRDREQRTLLPFEDMSLAVAVEPYFGAAAALDHEIDLLIEVLFRIERSGAGHLDDVAAPFPPGPLQLDIPPFPP